MLKMFCRVERWVFLAAKEKGQRSGLNNGGNVVDKGGMGEGWGEIGVCRGGERRSGGRQELRKGASGGERIGLYCGGVNLAFIPLSSASTREFGAADRACCSSRPSGHFSHRSRTTLSAILHTPSSTRCSVGENALRRGGR
jgi:hypothetical protein